MLTSGNSMYNCKNQPKGMIEKFCRIRISSVLMFICIIFFSCGYTKEDSEKYLPGQYFYKIPTGEMQELRINPDFTFRQIIYSQNKKEVLYENQGKMEVDGQKIRFGHWLECYELAVPKMLKNPYITDFTGIRWRKPKENERAFIVVFDQDDYIFRKLR